MNANEYESERRIQWAAAAAFVMLTLLFWALGAFASDYTRAPDGTYVASDDGTVSKAPDGSWHGGDNLSFTKTPDGKWHGEND